MRAFSDILCTIFKFLKVWNAQTCLCFYVNFLNEIRRIHLNLILYMGKVCSCRVEMLAKLKCWNKFGICYECTAVIFGEYFGFIFYEISEYLFKCWANCNLQTFFFAVINWNSSCSFYINDVIIKWDVKHLEYCKKYHLGNAIRNVVIWNVKILRNLSSGVTFFFFFLANLDVQVFL